MGTIIAPAESNDIAAVRSLFTEYAASLPFGLEYQDFAAELEGLPGPYVPPLGCLLLATTDAAVTGVVGLKKLQPRVGEIKRLYVVPEMRGSGLGKSLLVRAIEEARYRSYEWVRLDSHRSSMTRAIALYRALGFVEIPPYGPDLDGGIAFFEKRLQA